MKSGLLAPKHVDRIGPAIWTYLALLDGADYDSGILNGSPTDINRYLQETLGRPRTTILGHLDRLHTHGYIEWLGTTRLAITNYDSVKTWFRRRKSDLASKSRPPTVEPSTSFLMYQDTTYSTLKGFFEAILDGISQSRNPIAHLRCFWAFVWGAEDTPSFGRLGVATQRVGGGSTKPGCRILAVRTLVAALGRRVLGNPIDYVENMKGVAGGPMDGPSRQPATSPEGTPPPQEGREWADHGDWGQFVHGGGTPPQDDLRESCVS